MRRRRSGEWGWWWTGWGSKGLLLGRLLRLRWLLGLLRGLGLASMIPENLNWIFFRGMLITSSSFHSPNCACLATDHINCPTQLPIRRRASFHASSH